MSNNNITYYDVLGVDEDSTEDEIKQAYREQTKRYHPDTSDRANADEIFRDINQAKECLLDGKARIEHPTERSPLNFSWRNGEPLTDTADNPGNVDPHNGSNGGSSNKENSDERASGEDDKWKHNPQGESNSHPNKASSVEINNDSQEQGSEAAGEDGLSRREIITVGGIGGGALLLAYQYGLSGDLQDDQQDQRTTQQAAAGGGQQSNEGGGSEQLQERIKVKPSDSIQDAIKQTKSGGTIEIQPGTYNQQIILNKNLSIVAPEGATLSGGDLEKDTGIIIKSETVKIDNLDIVDYNSTAIQSESSVNRAEVNQVNITGNEGSGLIISGDQISITNSNISENDHRGVELFCSRTGEVLLDEVSCNQNTPEYSEKGGVYIEGGNLIELNNVEASNNLGTGIELAEGNARGQSINISSCESFGSQRGIRIAGTEGNDEVTVTETNISSEGIGIGIGETNEVESTSLNNVESTQNEGHGIRITNSPEASNSINNVILNQNEDDSWGRGIVIRGGSNIKLSNIEANNNRDDGIFIRQRNTRGQSIDISSCESFGSYKGIRIEGTDGTDKVDITDTNISSSSMGVEIGENSEIESVNVSNIESTENGYHGIRVTSSPEGSVLISNTKTNQNGDDNSGRGIVIRGSNQIELNSVESSNNLQAGVRVRSRDARSQNIKIVDSQFYTAKDGAGVYTGSTSGQDKNVIDNVISNGNSNYGLNLGGDSIIIENTTAESNENGPYKFRQADEEDITIKNSTAE